MKEKLKSIFKYVSIFVITVVVLFLVLVLTAKIPRSLIKENIEKSSDVINASIKENYNSVQPYKRIHHYADAMILNIIYYIDSNRAVDSVMEAKYYSKEQNESITTDVRYLISKHDEANTQYIRYWHGSMSILRPLLLFFDIGQIYVINAVILSILIIVLLIKLRRNKKLVIAIIIGLIMCYIFAVPFCVEYIWNFLIMLIASIIAISLVKKRKNTNILFFLTGILTCYFDFLTTEIITLFLPLIIILTLKYENKEIVTLKEALKIVLKAGIFWTIGYFGMWFAKWILASILLNNVNVFEHIIKPAIRRINGATYIPPKGNIRLEAIRLNLMALFPIDFLLEYDLLYWLLGGILAIEVIFIYKKDLKKLWFSLLLFFIATVPYLRYVVLGSHSYDHYFFTFRTQMISIVSIILTICYSLDKNILKYEFKKKNKFENSNVR